MAKAKSEVIENIFDEIVPVEGQETADIWGATYLPVQWQNLLGKWEFPLEHWGGSMLEFKYEISQVRHQSDMVDGFLLDSISVAPFAVKIHWGYRDASGKYIMAEQPLDDINPWRSRVHVLALLKEAESMTPVIITAGSNTGKYLLSNIRQGQRRLANMLKRIGYGDRPTHLFWMEMIAGKPVEVGEGEAISTICPPVTEPPVGISKITPKALAKHLTSIYVGHDIRDVFDNGLWDEGQEWSAKQPERLLLDDGTNGDNTALPPASTEAVVLVDGSLHIPDLSDAKPPAMKACAMSIPGMFNAQQHADNAFAKVMKRKRIGGASKMIQWEAWRDDLLERWDALQALNESQNREAEARLTPKVESEIPAAAELTLTAMDEVEAHAAVDEDDIPEAFQ